VRFAKIFDPGQQCCIAVWINVQKFAAHSDLGDEHADRCEHLYFLVFVLERSADSGVDLPACTARTQNTLKSAFHIVEGGSDG
jgi:hypothetical protein